MVLRILATVLFLVPCVATGQYETSINDTSSIDTYAAGVDTLVAKKKVQVFAKVPGKKALIAISKQSDFPENTEISYNVYVNKEGNLLYYFESPVSESGDWDMVVEHYFRSNGTLALVVYSVSGFNSVCTKIMRQEMKFYFDENYSCIGTSSWLTDKDHKQISAEGCTFNYKFPFTFYPTVWQLPETLRKATKGLKIEEY